MNPFFAALCILVLVCECIHLATYRPKTKTDYYIFCATVLSSIALAVAVLFHVSGV